MILIRDAHILENRENLAKGSSYVYVGRENSYYGISGSVLRNPFKVLKIGAEKEIKDSNRKAIKDFRNWLWEEIKKKGPVYDELSRLAKLAATGDLVLVCWCKNEQIPCPEEVSCHADIIRKAIQHWAEIEQRLNPSASDPQVEVLAHGGRHISMPDADVVMYPECFTTQESARFLERLLSEICWQQDYLTTQENRIPLPRLTAWYGDPGKIYSYSGIQMQPHPWTELLMRIRARVEAISSVEYNSVLLNLYRSGRDSVSWHQDNEPELGHDPVIASASFGATRIFQMRHLTKNIQQIDIPLSDGSLLVMRGSTQRYWRHSIPKTRQAVSDRVNLTFRSIR